MSAKRERPNHFDIDENTLEYKHKQELQKELKTSTSDQIKERMIYKVKNPNQEEQNTESIKSKSTLPSDLSKNPQPSENDKDVNEQNQTDKDPEKSVGSQKTLTPFLFASNSGTNLFGNGVGLFTNMNSVNLFEKCKDSFGTGSIFNPENDNKATIASNERNIFQTSKIEFGKGASQGIKNEASSGNEDNSAQLEEEQNYSFDPTKSTGSFIYNSECDIVFRGKLLKLKKPNGEILENVEISLQENLEKSSRWIVVKLCATKISVLSGLILKGKSQVCKMGSKNENLIVSVFCFKNKSLEKNILKLQFENSTAGETFFKLVSELIQ